MPAFDLTITHAHRTVMRRLDRGESAGDLSELLGALYLAELVDDDAKGPVLTEAGRAVLAAHDLWAAQRVAERYAAQGEAVPWMS